MSNSDNTAQAAERGDLADFRAEVRAWIAENKPAPPDFMLPQSFLEVETGKRRTAREVIMKMGALGLDSLQVVARRPHLVSNRLCVCISLYFHPLLPPPLPKFT